MFLLWLVVFDLGLRDDDDEEEDASCVCTSCTDTMPSPRATAINLYTGVWGYRCGCTYMHVYVCFHTNHASTPHPPPCHPTHLDCRAPGASTPGTHTLCTIGGLHICPPSSPPHTHTCLHCPLLKSHSPTRQSKPPLTTSHGRPTRNATADAMLSCAPRIRRTWRGAGRGGAEGEGGPGVSEGGGAPRRSGCWRTSTSPSSSARAMCLPGGCCMATQLRSAVATGSFQCTSGEVVCMWVCMGGNCGWREFCGIWRVIVGVCCM